MLSESLDLDRKISQLGNMSVPKELAAAYSSIELERKLVLRDFVINCNRFKAKYRCQLDNHEKRRRSVHQIPIGRQNLNLKIEDLKRSPRRRSSLDCNNTKSLNLDGDRLKNVFDISEISKEKSYHKNHDRSKYYKDRNSGAEMLNSKVKLVGDGQHITESSGVISTAGSLVNNGETPRKAKCSHPRATGDIHLLPRINKTLNLNSNSTKEAILRRNSEPAFKCTSSDYRDKAFRRLSDNLHIYSTTSCNNKCSASKRNQTNDSFSERQSTDYIVDDTESPKTLNPNDSVITSTDGGGTSCLITNADIEDDTPKISTEVKKTSKWSKIKALNPNYIITQLHDGSNEPKKSKPSLFDLTMQLCPKLKQPVKEEDPDIAKRLEEEVQPKWKLFKRRSELHVNSSFQNESLSQGSKLDVQELEMNTLKTLLKFRHGDKRVELVARLLKNHIRSEPPPVSHLQDDLWRDTLANCRYLR